MSFAFNSSLLSVDCMTHVLYRLKAGEMHYRLVYRTYRLCRCLGYKSILKSCDFQSHPAVNIVNCKRRLQSGNEIERMLEESGSEGDSVFFRK